MLKHRIIPTLLFDGVQCVKPVSFSAPYRKLGSMLQYIKIIESRNVDELMFLDITCTSPGDLPVHEPRYDLIKDYTKNLFCPVTIGGGVHSLDIISKLLNSGADKVAIRAAKYIIYEAARKFGSQAIVAVIEHGAYFTIEGTVDTAKWLEQEGAGEILLTDVQRDGTFKGYNLDLIRAVSEAVSIPIIANGGCSNPSDMSRAIENGANAVAAGSMFLYTEIRPKDCAEYLSKNKIPVRI